MPLRSRTIEVPEADEMTVDVLTLDKTKYPGTIRFWKAGAEIFNFTKAEALEVMAKGAEVTTTLPIEWIEKKEG